MNNYLRHRSDHEIPRVRLDENEQFEYKRALYLLSIFISDEFFDIPQLPDNKYEVDGLFYNIPYLDDTSLWMNGVSRTLVVVYKIEDKSSYCPLRIESTIKDENNFSITIHDQSGDRSVKHNLIEREEGTYYTGIKDHSSVTLSGLLRSITTI